MPSSALIGADEIQAMTRWERAALVAWCARRAVRALTLTRIDPGPHFMAVCEWAIGLVEKAAAASAVPAGLTEALHQTDWLLRDIPRCPSAIPFQVACAVASAVAAVHDDSACHASMASACAVGACRAAGLDTFTDDPDPLDFAATPISAGLEAMNDTVWG